MILGAFFYGLVIVLSILNAADGWKDGKPVLFIISALSFVWFSVMLLSLLGVIRPKQPDPPAKPSDYDAEDEYWK